MALLSEEEDLRIGAFEAVSWRAMENIFIQSQRGIVDSSYLDIRAKGASAMYTKKGYKKWSERKDSFPLDFVEYVETKFRDHGIRTGEDA